jgi:hypothetical protein
MAEDTAEGLKDAIKLIQPSYAGTSTRVCARFRAQLPARLDLVTLRNPLYFVIALSRSPGNDPFRVGFRLKIMQRYDANRGYPRLDVYLPVGARCVDLFFPFTLSRSARRVVSALASGAIASAFSSNSRALPKSPLLL